MSLPASTTGCTYVKANDTICNDLEASGDILSSKKHRPLAIPTAGAARSPSSSAPPSSGSARVDAIKDAGRRRLRGHPVEARLGQGAHDLHDPRAQRLVHLPSAHLGRAHPHLLLRGLRQAAIVHRRDHRHGGGALPRARAPTPGVTRRPPRSCCPRAPSAPSAAAPSFTQGDGHHGRLVRLRLHLGRRAARASLAPVSRRPLSGGRRPVPRLVPVLHADLHRRPTAWPPISRSSPTAGPWTVEGKAMHKSLGNAIGPRGDHQGLRRGHPAPVGGLRRLHPGYAHLQGHPEAAVRRLSEDAQHLPAIFSAIWTASTPTIR